MITYFFEQGNPDRRPDQFKDMTDSMWWALITMYTIGFGDQVPATFCGRFVGVCCAILDWDSLAAGSADRLVRDNFALARQLGPLDNRSH